MTASDFHKLLRTLPDRENNAVEIFRLNELVQKTEIDKPVIQEYLYVLETLGLIDYHDTEREVFSLTESGKLANLP